MSNTTNKSILQTDNSHCYLCGRNGAADRLEKHHIFGAADRQYSEEDGLYVWLCGDRCHRNGKQSVHQNKETADYLKAQAQHAWEKHYGTREQFMARFGKSYL